MAQRNSTSTRDGKAGNFTEKRSSKKSTNGSNLNGRTAKAAGSSALRDTGTGSTADKKMLRAWETINRNRGEAA